MSDERRQFERFDLEYTIQLVGLSDDMVITDMTTNISDGGARVPMPVECLPKTNADVQVNLTISRQGEKVDNYTGEASVLRLEDPDEEGMAEVVLQFSHPLKLRLQEAVEKLTKL